MLRQFGLFAIKKLDHSLATTLGPALSGFKQGEGGQRPREAKLPSGDRLRDETGGRSCNRRSAGSFVLQSKSREHRFEPICKCLGDGFECLRSELAVPTKNHSTAWLGAERCPMLRVLAEQI